MPQDKYIQGSRPVKSFDDSLIGKASKAIFQEGVPSGGVGLMQPFTNAVNQLGQSVLGGFKPGWASGSGEELSRQNEKMSDFSGKIAKGALGGLSDFIESDIAANEENKFLNKPISFTTESIADLQKMYGENLATSQLEAEGDKGALIDEMIEKGMTPQQVVTEAGKFTDNPEELASVKERAEKAAGIQSTGPVNDDNINSTAQKVKEAREGKDPTLSEKPEDLERRAGEDEYGAITNAVDKTASALYGKNITPENWYESKSFNMGLIRFGLGLLSGEDYATAFSNAAGDYTKLADREKREAYANELIADGYSQSSVMQWIDEGKANILTKPEVKETFSQYKDDAGDLWQRSSTTGKEQLLKAADRDSFSKYSDAEGNIWQVNARTGKEQLLKKAPTEGKGGSGKGPTESESKARFGGNRAQAAGNIWNVDYYGADKGEYPLATRTGTFYTGMADESQIKNLYGVTLGAEERKAAGKERAFLAGVLRPESGAAVSNSEWTNYGTVFFPRFGDDPQTLQQKAWMRDMTVQALKRAGNDFTKENEEEEARKIIEFMAQSAGNIVEYNPSRGAVKMADGKWYTANFNLR